MGMFVPFSQSCVALYACGQAQQSPWLPRLPSSALLLQEGEGRGKESVVFPFWFTFQAV